MILLVFVLVFTLLLAVLTRRGSGDRPGRLPSTVLAILVAFSPLALALAVIEHGASRLEVDRLTFEGKRLSFAEGEIVTVGGSPERQDDLFVDLLPPRALWIEPAGEELAAGLEGTAVGDPVLRLSTSPPVVRIDGRRLNQETLRDGDRMVLGDLELTFAGGELIHPGKTIPLPSRFKRLFRGGSTVVHLPDLLAEHFPEVGGKGTRSVLYRAAWGDWQLILRDRETRIERGEETVSMADVFALPRRFELDLQVTWGQAGRRYLRTVRSDRWLLEEGSAEIRFGNPQEVWIDGDASELAVVTASTLDRRARQIELAEGSPRFDGLAAGLVRGADGEGWSLEWLGDRQGVEPGALYAVGEGENQLLIRIRRSFQPPRLLLDLAVYGLFVLVFLGPPMGRRPRLAWISAPMGWLLALRLLFAERAAASPPDFAEFTYAEARIALWVVPALALLGWSFARLLRWTGAGSPWTHLRWPVFGMGIAALGGVLATWGTGRPPFLAAVPLGGGLLLWAVSASAERFRELPARWRKSGFAVGACKWIAISGVVVFAVRWAASLLGMPETLRLPAVDFRVLWTVLQLPVCALIFALGAEQAQRLARGIRRDEVGPWAWQIVALGCFVVVAYGFTAFVVRDTGLLIAHGLAPAAGLALLFAWNSTPKRPLHVAGLALCLLPTLLVLGLNARPDALIGLVGWGAAGESGNGKASRDIVDRAAALSSNRAQQMFRLYMLSNPEDLREIGLQPSEQVAIHYETLRSYASEAGFSGEGYASSRLPRHLGITYFSDLVPMVFALADFGTAGILALVAAYLGPAVWVILWGRRRAGPGDPLADQGAWIARMAILAFSLPSLYMILANLNLVLFTGKNCNLLSLNSISDVLESGALLGLAAFGLGLGRDSHAS